MPICLAMSDMTLRLLVMMKGVDQQRGGGQDSFLMYEDKSRLRA